MALLIYLSCLYNTLKTDYTMRVKWVFGKLIFHNFHPQSSFTATNLLIKNVQPQSGSSFYCTVFFQFSIFLVFSRSFWATFALRTLNLICFSILLFDFYFFISILFSFVSILLDILDTVKVGSWYFFKLTKLHKI